MRIPANEQETVIQISRDGNEANVWTSDVTMMTRLDKLVRRSPENYRLRDEGHSRIGGELVNKEYTITDKSLISFRPAKVKRDLSDEQRAEIANHLRRGRNSL